MGKIVIFGDSHSRYFQPELTLGKSYNWDGFFERLDCNVIHAASVKGFGKRNSTLNLKDDIVNKISKDDTLVLCFGQVDMELGLFYKQLIKNEADSEDAFIDECIDAYQVLIDLVKEKVEKIILKGINLPVLIEQQKAVKYTHRIITENFTNEDEISNAKKLLKRSLPNILRRITLAQKFNQRLLEFADKNNLRYFDINDLIAYPNGFLKEEFIPATFDHHLANTLKTRLIHLESLNKML